MPVTQPDQHAVELLNELFALEQRSLVARLPELHNFVSWLSADQLELVRSMTAEEHEHHSWLLDAIEMCGGGGPQPVSPDASLTSLHYVELHAVMPRVRQNVEQLVQAYERAASDPSLPPEIVPVINRIRQRHEQHLQQLRNLEADSSAD